VPSERLSGAAEAWLLRYDWPGNVRELSHLMERVTLLSAEAILAPETLERLCLPRPALSPRPESAPAGGELEPLDEPARIRQALIQAEGNAMRAARLLGLSRSALRYRLRRYGIERPGLEALARLPDTPTEREASLPSAPPFRPAGPAVPTLEWCLALCRLWNIALWSPRITAALGSAYALSGRVAEALPLLEQAMEKAASEKRLGEHALRVAELSEAYLLAGRTDDAFQTAQRALDLSRAHKERGHEAWALRLPGEIAAQRDPPDGDKAEASYRQALALDGELRMRPLMAHCHLGLGSLYARAGRRGRACAELSMALALYRALDMAFWLSRAGAALARMI
jgi:tetratricopeptide (TPR) repeat protein